MGNNAYGVLFAPRMLELGSSPSLVSGITSVSLGAGYLLCVVVAPLLHRLGCRRLAMPFTLIYSVSFLVAAFAPSRLGVFAGAAMVAGEWLLTYRGVAAQDERDSVGGL